MVLADLGLPEADGNQLRRRVLVRQQRDYWPEPCDAEKLPKGSEASRIHRRAIWMSRASEIGHSGVSAVAEVLVVVVGEACALALCLAGVI